MGNEFGAADLQPHLGYGFMIPYLLDWSTSTGTVTVLAGGYHQKLRLRGLTVINMGAACNATEPIINVKHGGNEVVETVDMATALSATAVIGELYSATIVDQYKDLDADEALQIEVETVDGGSDSRGLLLFSYELVE